MLPWLQADSHTLETDHGHRKPFRHPAWQPASPSNELGRRCPFLGAPSHALQPGSRGGRCRLARGDLAPFSHRAYAAFARRSGGSRVAGERLLLGRLSGRHSLATLAVRYSLRNPAAPHYGGPECSWPCCWLTIGSPTKSNRTS